MSARRRALGRLLGGTFLSGRAISGDPPTPVNDNLAITYGADPPNYGTTFDYYIRASGGSNSNDGQSYANAWATFDKAFTALQAETGEITIGVEGFTKEAVDLGSYDGSATYTKLRFYAYNGGAAGIDAAESITGWTQCTSGDTILDGLADKTVAYKKTFTPAVGSALASGKVLAFNLMEEGTQQVQARWEVAPNIYYAPFMRDRINSWYTSDSVTMDPTLIGDPPAPANYLQTLTDTDLIGKLQAGVEASQLFYHGDPNVAELVPIDSFNSTTGVVSVTSTRKPNNYQTDPNGPLGYSIVNAPHEITAAGQYAVVDAGGGDWTVYYYPNNAANLENGQVTYGARQYCLYLGDASDVEFYGLTFKNAGIDNTSTRNAQIENGPTTYGSNIKFIHCSSTDTAGQKNGAGGLLIGGTNVTVEHFTTERHLQGAGIFVAPSDTIRIGYCYFERTEQTPLQSTAINTTTALVYFPYFDISCAADPHINKTNWYGALTNPGWTGVLIHGAKWPYGFPGYVTWQRSSRFWITCSEFSTSPFDTRALENQSTNYEPTATDDDNHILLCNIGPKDGQTTGNNVNVGYNSSSGNFDLVGGCNVLGVRESATGFAYSLGGNNYVEDMPDKQATDFQTTSAAIWSDVTTQTVVEDGPSYALTGVDFSAKRTLALSLFDGCTDDSGTVFIDYGCPDADDNAAAVDWSNPYRGCRTLTDTYSPATQVASGSASALTATDFVGAVTVNDKNGLIEWFVDQTTTAVTAGTWATRKAAAVDESDGTDVVTASGANTVNGNDALTADTVYSFHWRWTNAFGDAVYGSEADVIDTGALENGDWQQFDGAVALQWTSPTGLPAGDMQKFTLCYTYKPEGSDASSNIQTVTIRGTGTTTSPFSNIWGSLLNNWNRIYDKAGGLLSNPISQTMTLNSKYAFFHSIDKTTDTVSYAIYNIDTGTAVVGPTTGSSTNTANDMFGSGITGFFVGASNVGSNDCFGEFERVHIFLEDYLEWTTTTVQHVIGSDFQTLQDKSVLEAEMSVSPIISMRGFDIQDFDNSDGTGGNPTKLGTGNITTAT